MPPAPGNENIITIEEHDQPAHAKRVLVRAVTSGGLPVTLLADADGTLHVAASISPSGTQDVNLIKVGGTAIDLGQEAMALSIPVVIASNQTNLPINTVQLGGASINLGAGAVGAGTQRQTLASDDPAVVALQIMDDWDETDRAKVNLIAGQAGITGGAGTVAANTPRIALATDANDVRVQDGSGNDITSGASGAKRPLDTNLVDRSGIYPGTGLTVVDAGSGIGILPCLIADASFHFLDVKSTGELYVLPTASSDTIATAHFIKGDTLGRIIKSLDRGTFTTLMSAQAFNNVTTSANSSTLTTSFGHKVEFEITIQSGGTGAHVIQFIPQFSNDGGTNWADVDDWYWQLLKFEDTEVTSQKFKSHLIESRGTLFRIRVVATGTTATLTFTVTLKARERSDA